MIRTSYRRHHIVWHRRCALYHPKIAMSVDSLTYTPSLANHRFPGLRGVGAQKILFAPRFLNKTNKIVIKYQNTHQILLSLKAISQND